MILYINWWQQSNYESCSLITEEKLLIILSQTSVIRRTSFRILKQTSVTLKCWKEDRPNSSCGYFSAVSAKYRWQSIKLCNYWRVGEEDHTQFVATFCISCVAHSGDELSGCAMESPIVISGVITKLNYFIHCWKFCRLKVNLNRSTFTASTADLAQHESKAWFRNC
jgi:hypothetical protein